MAEMKSRWVILQHVEWEGPGMIASEATRRGLDLEVLRLDRGDKIPEADQVNGMVVMGGPLGAYEVNKYPFLTKECELLSVVARSGRPVLGVCLGAQLLAKALGATVSPGHGEEIGFGSVNISPAGRRDTLFAGMGDVMPAFHWHGDTFTLPEGAELLASDQMYPHQAFRYGSRAYGFQFHIEPDANTWEDWRSHLPEHLLDSTKEKKRSIAEAGRKVITRFFDLAMNTAATEVR